MHLVVDDIPSRTQPRIIIVVPLDPRFLRMRYWIQTLGPRGLMHDGPAIANLLRR